MKRVNVDIKGMHCQSCVVLVEKSLNKVKGIKTATVNLTTEKARVDYDEKKIDEEVFDEPSRGGISSQQCVS